MRRYRVCNDLTVMEKQALVTRQVRSGLWVTLQSALNGCRNGFSCSNKSQEPCSTFVESTRRKMSPFIGVETLLLSIHKYLLDKHKLCAEYYMETTSEEENYVRGGKLLAEEEY